MCHPNIESAAALSVCSIIKGIIIIINKVDYNDS